MTEGARVLKRNAGLVNPGDRDARIQMDAFAALGAIGLRPTAKHDPECAFQGFNALVFCDGRMCESVWPEWAPDSVFEKAYALADDAASSSRIVDSWPSASARVP